MEAVFEALVLERRGSSSAGRERNWVGTRACGRSYATNRSMMLAFAFPESPSPRARHRSLRRARGSVFRSSVSSYTSTPESSLTSGALARRSATSIASRPANSSNSSRVRAWRRNEEDGVIGDVQPAPISGDMPRSTAGGTISARRARPPYRSIRRFDAEALPQ